MKNYTKLVYTLISLLVLFVRSNAQDSLHWGVGFQISTIDKSFIFDNPVAEYEFYYSSGHYENHSFSFGLSGYIYFKENLAFRLKMDESTIKILFNRNTDEENNEVPCASCFVANETINEKRYYISPGILFKNTFKRFDLVFGFEVPLSLYKEYSIERNTTYYDTSFSNVISITKGITTIPGGYSLGLAAFGGINVILSKHFHLGSELSSAFVYTNVGGRVVLTSNVIYPSPFSNTLSYQLTQKGLSILNSKLSFNLIYLFK